MQQESATLSTTLVPDDTSHQNTVPAVSQRGEPTLSQKHTAVIFTHTYIYSFFINKGPTNDKTPPALYTVYVLYTLYILDLSPSDRVGDRTNST